MNTINDFNADILDEEDMRVTLTMEDDSEVECQILTIFDVDDKDYIALLPLNESGEPNQDGDVFLYRFFEDEDGEPSLENIEDDDEYEMVADRFDELLDESLFDDMDED